MLCLEPGDFIFCRKTFGEDFDPGPPEIGLCLPTDGEWSPNFL